MLRLLIMLGLLVAHDPTRAQPWLDLGPSLGLPSQTQGPSGVSLSAGLTAADLDGDGDLDLLSSTPSLGLVAYLYNGTTFTADRTLLPAITSAGTVFGHTLFDADNDGDLDLHVLRDDGDRLFFRDSTTTPHTWRDRTNTHLPRLLGWSVSSTAADLDGDGDLDLVLARYIDRIDFPAHRCFANRIYLNDGRGLFSNATPPAFAATLGCSFSTVAHDYDDDQDLDLFVVNDFVQFTGRIELWENRGFQADGTLDFAEVSQSRGLEAPIYGMGLAFEDLDQDGHPELLITSIGEPLLFELGTDLNFRPINTEKNLYWRFAYDRLQATWTTRFLDLDGDGHLDVLAAGGTLPAAPFIGNPPDQGSVTLRGQADGSLIPVPVAFDFPRAGHSARDFDLVDFDGDGIDELLAVHVQGRISAFKNLVFRDKLTRLELVPSTTARNATGARVTLTCAGITRTRRLNAGGDYGTHDRGRVDLSFPAPCAEGLSAQGVVQWPSGFSQAITVTVGQLTRVTEPTWFSLDDATVTLDLGQHSGSANTVAIAGHGLELGPVVPLGARRFSATYSQTDPTGGRFDLTVDGAPWGFHPRVAATTPTLSWSAVPVVGRDLVVRMSFPDPANPPANPTATLGAQTVAMTALDDHTEVFTATLSMPLTAGPTTLTVSWDGASLTHTLEVTPAVGPDSEVFVRELHILAAERETRRVRLRARLFDTNFEPAGVPLEDLAVLIDGEPAEPDVRSIESGAPTIGIEHARLHDGAMVQLTISGVPHFAPQRVAQVAGVEDYAQLVAKDRSHCWFSEPRGRADGTDIVTALIQFSDAGGTRIPDTGIAPLMELDGLTVFPGSLEIGYGGWKVDLVTSTRLGPATLSTRLPAMADPITCGILLAAPPLLPDPITNSTLVSLSSTPVIDQSITIRAWPLGPDGRSLGSGVPLTVATSDNADHTAPTYIGHGRYQFFVTPRAPGHVAIQLKREDGAVIAATTLWEGGIPPDNSPEPGPETTEEQDVEVSEPVEPTDPIEDVEDAEDVDAPDSADTDTGPTPDTEEDTEPGQDTNSGTGDADADTLPATDLGEDDTSASDTRHEADSSRGRDKGCAHGHAEGLGLALALMALLGRRILWRAHPNARRTLSSRSFLR